MVTRFGNRVSAGGRSKPQDATTTVNPLSMLVRLLMRVVEITQRNKGFFDGASRNLRRHEHATQQHDLRQQPYQPVADNSKKTARKHDSSWRTQR